MKKVYALLAGIILAAMLSANLVVADVAVGPVNVGAGPGDSDPKICVFERKVKPDGINDCEYRAGQYAFAGELIAFGIIVRDPNGVEDIGFAKIQIDGEPEVLCNLKEEWPDECDGLGNFEENTDLAYVCHLTVEPTWYDYSTLTISVWNTVDERTDATHSETWFFNPGIALSVETTDELPIHFEDAGPGEWAHSENHIKIMNVGEGGVNLWMYIAGTNLYGTDGAAKCPWSNVLEIENMWFRGWSGTLDPSDIGICRREDLDFDCWRWMPEYDENDGCDMACDSYKPRCYGGKTLPGRHPMDNVLTNGGLMEVEFKILYPVPCVGTFSNGEILIFGKAI